MSSRTQPESAAHVRVITGLHAITLLLLALHVYVRTLPPTVEPIPTPADAEAAWWGLWPVTYLAPLWFWLGTALVLATLVWSWRMATTVAPARPTISPRWFYAISALLVITFYLFPIVHTRWGDAYILSQAISWPDPTLRLTHSWQAPLDVFLHSQVWLAMGESRGWQNAMPVYQLLSPLAGAIFLVVLVQFAQDTNFAPGWLTFGLVASLGLVQLFFGYIENYSFAAAGILTFLWLARRVLQNRAPLWLATLALALTNATHPSTVILAPAALFLAWATWQRGTASHWRVVVETALPPLLVAAATLALMEAGGHGLQAIFTTDRPGGSDASWFVPLWGTRTRWEAYTLLSRLHVRDLINQALLVAPVVLPNLLWMVLSTQRVAVQAVAHAEGKQTERETRRFLAIASLCYLMLITLWNPDYGGQRDWDLFSLAWIPTTLWLVSIAQARLDRSTLMAGFAPLIVLQAMHTAAWIYQNTLPWDWP